MFLLRDKLIMQGEKRETSTQTCNETMLRAKLRVFVSRISPPLKKLLKRFYLMMLLVIINLDILYSHIREILNSIVNFI